MKKVLSLFFAVICLMVLAFDGHAFDAGDSCTGTVFTRGKVVCLFTKDAQMYLNFLSPNLSSLGLIKLTQESYGHMATSPDGMIYVLFPGYVVEVDPDAMQVARVFQLDEVDDVFGIAVQPEGNNVCVMAESAQTCIDLNAWTVEKKLAATAAKIVINSSVNFGNAMKGENIDRWLTVKNSGSGNLLLNGMSITGVNNLDFSVNTSCPNSLGPKSECGVDVFFAPKSYGSKTATLEIQSNDPKSSVKKVSLKGNCIAPAMSAPSSVNLGNIKAGNIIWKKVTIKNTGGADLTFTPSISGNVFEIDGSGPCSISNGQKKILSPKEACEFYVTFMPTAKATYLDTMLVSHDDPKKNNPFPVSLKGVGK